MWNGDFRRGHQTTQPANDQWDQLIFAMIELVPETYAAFSERYHVATAALPAMPIPGAPAAKAVRPA